MVGETDDDIADSGAGARIESLVDGSPRIVRVDGRKVFLCRIGPEVRAFDVECPHLGGPLDEGLTENGVVTCPWHHARFDLRTGAALAAPAFDALTRRETRVEDGLVKVGAARPPSAAAARASGRRDAADPMVIVGGGAAGFTAADTLRKSGWAGEITLVSADPHPPYDRTLLTKDYLDGQFGDDRLAVAQHGLKDIDVRPTLNTSVEAVDIERKLLRLSGGGTRRYGKLLLAMGAEPRVARIPGAESSRVHYLRSLDDCRRLLGAIGTARRVAVLGGSFIGLEAAASLRSRGLEIHLITPELHPMSKVFGRELSDLIVNVHRKNGVALHLGREVARVEGERVILDDGATLNADLMLVGIGVEPRVGLAKTAGLRLDRGVLVDACLRTSAPGVFAAGDIARWPDPHSGQSIRVEHWVVAERQGQTAAANMLGAATPFEDVPFFWTKHFDLAVLYLGHADDWEEVSIEGSIADRNALIRYRKGGRDLAVATIGRDRESLEAERLMMRNSRENRRSREQA
jgi:NADPH-dependent 2,4-dienoyl-CoA reductase/sulfur reductase-like enzyme/nitrite reductase/ring-hydroxylating ferredoxin subunit